MTRTLDRPVPPYALHHHPTLDALTVRPVILIEGPRTVAEWDDTPLEEWDNPLLEWDMDLVPGYLDATCDYQAVETAAGPPDDRGIFPASQATIQLANPTGTWSRFNTDGSPTAYGPGTKLIVLAHYNTPGTDWYVFRGTVTGWSDLGDHVEIEAHDAFADLAQPIGTYTPGVNGDTTVTRLNAIVAAAGRTGIPVAFAAGDVVLTAQATTQSPVDEMRTVSASDGGELFTDADGTVVYYRRTWRAGRTDQTLFPVISDNVCTADIRAWDTVLSTSDATVADTVILENVAKLHSQSPAGAIGRFILTATGLQYTTLTEGDTLASFMWTNQQTARVEVAEFDLYLHDPNQPDLYRAVEWRLFDKARFIHDYTAADGVARLDVNMLVSGIGHQITPDGWIMSVATGKANSFNQNNVWNPPGDPYVWDTVNTVWGYQ